MGRPPRQRHAGHLLRRRQRLVLQHPPIALVSRHRRANETGEGKGAGKIINCPLPAGSGRAEIVAAFREQLLPAAEAFHPDLVLISAGFDSRINDPLGQFLLTDTDFRELTGLLLDIAAKYSNGRLVSILEGGYNLEGLALAAEAHVRALTGDV